MTCNTSAPGEAVGRTGIDAAAGCRFPMREAVCRYPGVTTCLVGGETPVAVSGAEQYWRILGAAECFEAVALDGAVLAGDAVEKEAYVSS